MQQLEGRIYNQIVGGLKEVRYIKYNSDLFMLLFQSKISKSIKEGKDEEKKEKDMIIFQEMITIPNQEEIDELVEGELLQGIAKII